MNQPSSNQRVAIVHDDFIQNGGAEKLVLCLLEIFPQADIFTSIISDEWAQRLRAKNPEIKIKASFINRIPHKRKLYKFLALLYPIGFRTLKIMDYDLVISSTARFAHGVKTPKDTLHVAYVNSPGRMIWEPQDYFDKHLLPFVYPFILMLRLWDKRASRYPDVLAANSQTIQKRIKKYWKRDSEVVYPFHDINKNSQSKKSPGKHFIVVSRLEKWKRIDIAVKACSKLKQKLVIVGDGRYKNELKKMADPEYVQFMGRLNNSDLVQKYLEAHALIMTQKEDFGITSVEAQSLGVPVIAYKSGGALETVAENHTGIFFESQDSDSLEKALSKFSRIEINPEKCIIQASKFTKDEFIRRIIEITESHGKQH